VNLTDPVTGQQTQVPLNSQGQASITLASGMIMTDNNGTTSLTYPGVTDPITGQPVQFQANGQDFTGRDSLGNTYTLSSEGGYAGVQETPGFQSPSTNPSNNSSVTFTDPSNGQEVTANFDGSTSSYSATLQSGLVVTQQMNGNITYTDPGVNDPSNGNPLQFTFNNGNWTATDSEGNTYTLGSNGGSVSETAATPPPVTTTDPSTGDNVTLTYNNGAYTGTLDSGIQVTQEGNGLTNYTYPGANDPSTGQPLQFSQNDNNWVATDSQGNTYTVSDGGGGVTETTANNTTFDTSNPSNGWVDPNWVDPSSNSSANTVDNSSNNWMDTNYNNNNWWENTGDITD
jgi:hypothetical protein